MRQVELKGPFLNNSITPWLDHAKKWNVLTCHLIAPWILRQYPFLFHYPNSLVVKPFHGFESVFCLAPSSLAILTSRFWLPDLTERSQISRPKALEFPPWYFNPFQGILQSLIRQCCTGCSDSVFDSSCTYKVSSDKYEAKCNLLWFSPCDTFTDHFIRLGK